MRALAILVLLALPACSAAHETTGDAAAVDAGLDARVPLVARSVSATMTTCACHHGCGPGLDGTFGFEITNPADVARTLTVTGVTVDSIGSPGGPYRTPDDGTLRVSGADATGAITIPAGATISFEVTVYLDIPIVEPGTDSVTFDVIAAGDPVTFQLSAVDVTTAPGC